MNVLCISVIGIFCGGNLGFRVFSPIIQLFGLLFFLLFTIFQLIRIDIKVYKADLKNPMLS